MASFKLPPPVKDFVPREKAVEFGPFRDVLLMQRQYNATREQVEAYLQLTRKVAKWKPESAKLVEVLGDFRGVEEKLVEKIKSIAWQVTAAELELGKLEADPNHGRKELRDHYEGLTANAYAARRLLDKSSSAWTKLKLAYEDWSSKGAAAAEPALFGEV